MKPWIAWMWIGILFGVACFQVRPVEPPDTLASDWVSPTDYQILLENLKTAVGKGNTQNYLRCFNQDSLQFLPSAALLTNNETVWLNWSIEDEQAYFNNMLEDLSVAGSNALLLDEQDLQDVSADSLRYVGDYSLRINHQDTNLTTLFEGQIQLLIKLNEFNEWEIFRWTDIELRADSSWSQLKLRYSQ
ncbi:MAG: hypothetical protein AAFR61_09685 [Bacteroidota bacterium]